MRKYTVGMDECRVIHSQLGDGWTSVVEQREVGSDNERTNPKNGQNYLPVLVFGKVSGNTVSRKLGKMFFQIVFQIKLRKIPSPARICVCFDSTRKQFLVTWVVFSIFLNSFWHFSVAERRSSLCFELSGLLQPAAKCKLPGKEPSRQETTGQETGVQECRRTGRQEKDPEESPC